jgi:hypothetical protein
MMEKTEWVFIYWVLRGRQMSHVHIAAGRWTLCGRRAKEGSRKVQMDGRDPWICWTCRRIGYESGRWPEGVNVRTDFHMAQFKGAKEA